jgi:hypothetical protein
MMDETADPLLVSPHCPAALHGGALNHPRAIGAGFGFASAPQASYKAYKPDTNPVLNN